MLSGQHLPLLGFLILITLIILRPATRPLFFDPGPWFFLNVFSILFFGISDLFLNGFFVIINIQFDVEKVKYLLGLHMFLPLRILYESA